MPEDFREELGKEMRDFKTKLERELRTEMREFRKSLEFMNDELEKTKKEQKELLKENKALKEANAKLAADCEMLKKQSSEHEQRLTASEQYSRNRNIEIKGIPLSSDEKLLETLHRVGELLNVPIDESDVEVCHRVVSKNVKDTPNIVAQFKSRSKRDMVLHKAKKMRITSEDFGHSQGTPVFINEHLSPAMKHLLGMAIAKKKAQNWRFVWTSNGKILARKEESAPVVRNRTAQDVEKIV
ncbi:hypothetical protein HPB51_021083 [Rhipicephalus microplus]|uniref:FP protein C-terminal domain-containing protein n=1 Tax=Rhipicephalus microplus TaxID=6941 RepID=A0A9J6DC29_RHIMP|nr:uncharacterized protein LOC119175591 [Rhipicephalus microplus]KAH8019724.1 hypothetical protein HPB51_021083 [Rhipicephalus microplus]